MTIRGFADLSVPPLPDFSERDALFLRQNRGQNAIWGCCNSLGLLCGCKLCLKSEDDNMSFRSKWKLLAQSSALGMVRYTVKARRTIFYAADEAIQEM